MLPINQNCINLIKHWESLELKPYHGKADRPGVDTVGWGVTRYPPYYLSGKAVKVGDPSITEQQAEDFLMYWIKQTAAQIEGMLKPKLTGNQYAALISFAYNLGASRLKESTLLRRINAGSSSELITEAFMMWVYSDGKKVKGLINRRRAEVELYFTK